MGDNDVSLFLLFVISFIFSGCTKEKFFPWYFSSCSDFEESFSSSEAALVPEEPTQNSCAAKPLGRAETWHYSPWQQGHPLGANRAGAAPSRGGKGLPLPGCLSLGRAPLVLTTPLSFQVRKHNCLRFWSEELSLRKESGVSSVL